MLGGGYWYLRNLIVAGNPLPQATGLGPISLPHPERLQEGRPDFSIVHYVTDTGVWRDYFEPGLHQAFGALWPLVILGALVGALLALLWARDGILRWMGGVALFGMLAYLFTPLSAAGAEGAPVGFGINIRYAIPALLLGLVLLPLARWLDGRRRQWALLGLLLAILVLTDRSDAVLRDPARVFAIGLALLLVVVPAALLLARARGAAKGVVVGGFAALALLVFAIGYPIQRDYLRDRFAAGSEVPGMQLDPAYDGHGTSATPASAWRARPPASSSTASTAPTSPTASSTWAKRAPTAPTTQSPPAPPSAPPSTPPTSTTSSPAHSSTSSTPTPPCHRQRQAGYAATQPPTQSAAAAQ